MENILVSACLFGKNTKYNGGNNYNPKVERLMDKYNVILYCPEVMGGLTTPRLPSEIIDSKVINNEGTDVTLEFTKGANLTLELCKKYNIKKALLKDGSPSCGSSYIYDGTFTSNKINGMGITAKLLDSNNIIVYNESEIDTLIDSLSNV